MAAAVAASPIASAAPVETAPVQIHRRAEPDSMEAAEEELAAIGIALNRFHQTAVASLPVAAAAQGLSAAADPFSSETRQ